MVWKTISLLLIYLSILARTDPVEECLPAEYKALKSIFNSTIDTNPLFLMGTTLNDLGHYDACIKNPGFTYILAYLDLTYFSPDPNAYLAQTYIAWCMPKSCEEKSQFESMRTFLVTNLGLNNKSVSMFNAEKENLKYKSLTPLSIIIIVILGVYLIISTKLILLFFGINIFREEGKISLNDALIGSDSEQFETDVVESSIDPLLKGETENSKNLNLVRSGDATAARTTLAQTAQLQKRRALTFVQIVDKFFDIKSNYNSLFERRIEDKELFIFDGIKTVTLAWIVICQTKEIFKFLPIRNYDSVVAFVKGFIYQFVMNATFILDVLFALSGFFLSYTIVKKLLLNNNNKYNFKDFGSTILTKFLSTYPLYLLAFLFYWKVLIFTMNSPLASLFNKDLSSCQEQYPYILTLLYNFTILGFGEQFPCVEWYWYIPNEFQLTIIGSILLLLYKDNKVIFWMMTVVLNLACFCYLGYLFYSLDVGVNFFELGKNNEKNRIFLGIFGKAGPYFVGYVFGIIYAHYKTMQQEEKENHIFNYVKKSVLLSSFFYLLGICIMVFLVIIVYWSYDNPWSLNVRIAYNLGSRCLFVIGMFFTCLPLILGQLKSCSSCIKSDFYVSLSNLSFCVYLIHPIIIKFFYYNFRAVLYFKFYFLLFFALAYVGLSFVLSYVISPLCEVPFIQIGKYLSDKSVDKRETLKIK